MLLLLARWQPAVADYVPYVQLSQFGKPVLSPHTDCI